MEQLEITKGCPTTDQYHWVWVMSVHMMRERHRVIMTRATTCRTTMRVRSHGKDTQRAEEHARKDHTEHERGIVGKEIMCGRVGEEMTEERKEAMFAPRREAHLLGTVTRTNDPMDAKTKTKTKEEVTFDIAKIAQSKGTLE